MEWEARAPGQGASSNTNSRKVESSKSLVFMGDSSRLDALKGRDNAGVGVLHVNQRRPVGLSVRHLGVSPGFC